MAKISDVFKKIIIAVAEVFGVNLQIEEVEKDDEQEGKKNS